MTEDQANRATPQHSPIRETKNPRRTRFTIYDSPFTNRIPSATRLTSHILLLTASQGFSLTELLLALNISFILMALCFALFISSSKLFSGWQARSTLKRDVSTIVHRLSLDITRASTASAEADSLLFLSQPNGRTVKYRIAGSEIARNSVVMNDPNERGLIVRLNRAFSGGGGLNQWKYEVSGSNKRGTHSLQSASALLISAQNRFQETSRK